MAEGISRPSKPVVTPKGVELTVNPQWEVHPAQVKECLEKKEEMLLLDVRMQREWDFAHLPGATLIPLGQLVARTEELREWKSRPVVVYCHLGMRSMTATAYLREQGFENVHSMAGGIEGWSLMVDEKVPRY